MNEQTIQILLIIGFIWSIPWKAVALWKSSRLSHKKWFIVFIILNTFAILEIYYIFFVAKKYMVEEVEDKSTN